MDPVSPTKPVRVRIAPSPTGDPHVGTAYIGLINYVFARQNRGQFLIRIEDTDQSRSSVVFERAIFRSLKWFGLTWDEGPDVGGPYGPYRQSERTAIYQQHAEQLIATGGAYRCFCTSERIDALRESQRAQKLQMGYDRHCRDLAPEELDRLLEARTAHVIRLRMPVDGETVVPDRLRGEVRFQNALIDDGILLKSDGFPTYHLANVIDDHLMKISHVIRAEEWLNSTPKHLLLYQAFGWDAPEFIHLPLLRNRDLSKISKRKNPVSLTYYEQAGYLPETLRNFLALMGWTHPEGRDKFSLQEMIETFSIDKISLGGPIFDLEKLKWLNGLYIRELTIEQLRERLIATLFDPEYLSRIAPLVKERMEVFEDFWRYADYFLLGAPENLRYDLSQLMPKGRTTADVRKMLSAVLEKLEEASRQGWTAPILEAALRAFCEHGEWKAKEVFMAVRVVATARTATPPLFETLELLGKEQIRRRFQHVDGLLKAHK